MKKRILVTGGAGFIGSHLVDRLIDEENEVAVVDDLSGGFKRNINPKAIFFKIDLRKVNKNHKKDIFEISQRFKPEIVYHLAANAAENKAQFSPIDVTSRNYNAFINTLVAALQNGLKRIIVTSSIAVYGSLQIPFRENDKPEPEDLYGISKLAMEESLKILSKVHGFEFVITRPHNVYGPRQNMSDPYRNVVTIFMNSVMKNEPFYIYGDGKQRRCFTYIDDVIDSLFKCGFDGVDGKIFNIGSDIDYSLNDLANMIIKVTGSKIKPKYLPERPQEVRVAIADHTQAKKLLQYKDMMGLEDGLKKTWQYAKSLGPQEYSFGDIELPNPKMPENWIENK